jgi:hypothetical protein
MECPYCGAELVYEDYYYRGNHAAYEKGYTNIEILGDIYHCSNHEGFENEEDAIKYAEENNVEYENWEEIVCESACLSVSGSFYTDKQGNLHEGYPC